MSEVLTGPTEWFVETIKHVCDNRVSPYQGQADHHVKVWTWEQEVRLRAYSLHILDWNLHHATRSLIHARR